MVSDIKLDLGLRVDALGLRLNALGDRVAKLDILCRSIKCIRSSPGTLYSVVEKCCRCSAFALANANAMCYNNFTDLPLSKVPNRRTRTKETCNRKSYFDPRGF